MQSKQNHARPNHARPIVLRELSLLRALGASRRTFSYRLAKLRRSSLSFVPLPQPDPSALPLPHRARGLAVPDKSSGKL